MAHQAFDEQMAALDALRNKALEAPDRLLVKRALASKSNFLVAKAAKLAEENGLQELAEDMIHAFGRFFENGEKTDPQCWAKNALSGALSKLECRDKEVFLRGLRYQQMEPVWGGRSDSAGTLRANCAHALVACEGLLAQDLLVLLVDLLADTDTSVRVEAIRALAQVGDLAVPVLRLRALVRDQEPEVMATCFSSLLAIDRSESVAFVARFLSAKDAAANEAAYALAETHSEAALEALLKARVAKPAPDPEFASTLLQAIALTRLEAGISQLLGLIEAEDRDAPEAIEALARVMQAPEARTRLRTVVAGTGSSRLLRLLEQELAANEVL